MNVNDNDQNKQKEVEERSLNCVLNYLNGDEYTQEYIKWLKTLTKVEEYPKTHETHIESPDFLFLDPQNPNNIIGIEHFAVNKQSEEFAPEKVRFKTTEYNQKIEDLINKYQDEVVNQGVVSQECLKDMSECMTFGYNMRYASTFPDLMKSYNHSINKHVKKINNYTQKINDKFDNIENIQLDFLIDIQAEFYNLNYVLWPCVQQTNISTANLFIEFLKKLDKLKNKKINNFILCMRSYDNSIVKVFVIKNHNIYNQLEERQLHPVKFFYCSKFDERKPTTIHMSTTKNHLFDINTTKDLSSEQVRVFLLSDEFKQLYNEVIKYMEEQKPFCIERNLFMYIKLIRLRKMIE